MTLITDNPEVHNFCITQLSWGHNSESVMIQQNWRMQSELKNAGLMFVNAIYNKFFLSVVMKTLCRWCVALHGEYRIFRLMSDLTLLIFFMHRSVTTTCAVNWSPAPWNELLAYGAQLIWHDEVSFISVHSYICVRPKQRHVWQL